MTNAIVLLNKLGAFCDICQIGLSVAKHIENVVCRSAY